MSIISDNRFYREKGRILSAATANISSKTTNSSKTDYNTIWPDQIDEKAYWFRNHFVGKPYITLIGPIMDDENDLAIISIVKEQLQYRIIVRTKQVYIFFHQASHGSCAFALIIVCVP